RAPPSRSYRPQPESRSRCRSDCSSKNRCQASFVCPYKSPQKLSFISARKCWKCSLIGIIFAIGCRSPFQERLSLVRQSQLTPSRLLHNQRYVTLSEPDLNWLLPPRILTARHEGSCHHSGSGSRHAHGVCSGIERKEAGCLQAIYRAWRNANPYSYTA